MIRVIVICTIFLSSAFVHGQFYEVSIEQPDSIEEEEKYVGFYGMDFSTANMGIMVGNNGFIWKSTDGGENWFIVDAINEASWHRFNVPFFSVDMYDNMIGYAVGGSQEFYKTEDGGESWKATALVDTPFQGKLLLKEVVAYSKDTVYLGGSHLQGVFRTTDGGSSFETYYLPQQASVVGNIKFLDKQRGYLVAYGIVGGNVGVYYTTTAGDTWDWIGKIKDPTEIAYFGSDTIYKGKSEAAQYIEIFTDYGEEYLSSYLFGGGPPRFPFSYGLNNTMHFFNSQVGYFWSLDRVYKTSDGGKNWDFKKLPNRNITEAYFINEDTFFIMNLNFKVYKTTTGLQDPTGTMDATYFGNEPEIFPNPVNGQLNIDLKNHQIKKLFISDISGKIIKQISDVSGALSVNTSRWPAGVYIISMQNKAKAEYIQKVVKE